MPALILKNLFQSHGHSKRAKSASPLCERPNVVDRNPHQREIWPTREEGIEKIDEGYVIQNDNPVVIRIPYIEGHHPFRLKLYDDGKLIEQRDIFVNRNNPNQVDFRLDKAYEKVVVVLEK